MLLTVVIPEAGAKRGLSGTHWSEDRQARPGPRHCACQKRCTYPQTGRAAQ